MKKVIIFAATAAALQAAHHIGDYWVQTSHQAAEKGSPGAAGALACARHVASYTATCTAAVVALRALGAPISMKGILAGQAVNALSHFVMDRRPSGRAIMNAAGKSGLADLGTEPPDSGKPDHLGTGRHALDQSWHIAWLAVSAYVTAAVA